MGARGELELERELLLSRRHFSLLHDELAHIELVDALADAEGLLDLGGLAHTGLVGTSAPT